MSRSKGSVPLKCLLTVRSTITYTLPTNVENLILEGTANINGTGNTLNNSITGNSGNNNFSGAVGATISDSQGLGTITNDDFPSIAINDVTITEGNSGTINAVFTVTRTGTVLQPITVNYATANGTTNPATARSDYVAQTGTLTFATTETSKTISVVINGDKLRRI